MTIFQDPFSLSRIITFILAIVTISATFASRLKWDDWWIRAFDFPRIQISALLLITLMLTAWVYDFSELWHFFLLFLLLCSLAYQAYRIYPYTLLAPKQVLSVQNQIIEPEKDNTVSVLVSNVLTPNRQSHRLLEVVRKKNPDILLTLESDKWWEDKLNVLEPDYPYTVKVPLDNLYGMHLYSRLELIDAEVNYLVESDVPSIETTVKLKSGKTIRLFCLHPAPPSPSQNETSAERDAELLMVANKLDADNETILVMGDLNDVAWSRTTSLFLKMSGLLDPRRGRGFFNTFHAGHLLLRWPLDHIFHSNDFKLIAMERQKNIGSDHFPIYSKLLYSSKAQYAQNTTDSPSTEEKEEAVEKIKKGTEG
ncbi:Uncharacterized conserved protein YafD, endonuclease/exonuclease/phosphatase (EEP) superfamily [Saccharicrinis carchari]|uniref:Uncharacterized conserved protein YafD, endonuclease/exonuclease/phosphatase (EEP) superfamily n=2 Tax=Saccharicrinis carchari TaxID=1168039 RepID=A0A521DX58_SACCC|nr:Uncharacterized conserved protein YafD, endonuclease/exonuclease/phosphatase (EEP) superfamily [Saccharicrinis carchari]